MRSANRLIAKINEEARRIRITELSKAGFSLPEIAAETGVSVRNVLSYLEKSLEVELAGKFLVESGLLSGSVRTLKEYKGTPTCPETNRDWDDISPDIVVCGSVRVGLELTAYGDQVENQVYGIRREVSKHVREVLASKYSDLLGVTVFWKPNYDNPLPKSRTIAFCNELLSFVRDRLHEEPLAADVWKRFPNRWNETTQQVFADSNLLRQHAIEVKVFRGAHLDSLPVSVSLGSHTTYRGTKVETLVGLIRRKNSKQKSVYRSELEGNWLLIHAARALISSDIYTLFPGEIERLLDSEAAEAARESYFDRVILWDGVDGGYVDLKNSESVPFNSL